MTTEHDVDRALAELREALEVEPSGWLQTSIRQAVAGERTVAQARRLTWQVATAVGLMVILGATFVASRQWMRSTSETVAPTELARSAESARPEAGSDIAASDKVATMDTTHFDRSRQARPVEAAQPAAGSPVEPDRSTVVVTDQLDVLRVLWAQAGRPHGLPAPIEGGPVPLADGPPGELTVEPIRLSAIVVPSVTEPATTSGPGGGGAGIRRINADTIVTTRSER